MLFSMYHQFLILPITAQIISIKSQSLSNTSEVAGVLASLPVPISVNPTTEVHETNTGGLLSKCTKNSDCQSGYLCGSITGACFLAYPSSVRQLCTSNNDCRTGYICNTFYNTCIQKEADVPDNSTSTKNTNFGVNSCNQNSECSVGYICNSVTKVCSYSYDASGICATDSDCLGTNVCSAVTKTCSLKTTQPSGEGLSIIISVMSIIVVLFGWWIGDAISILLKERRMLKKAHVPLERVDSKSILV